VMTGSVEARCAAALDADQADGYMPFDRTRIARLIVAAGAAERAAAAVWVQDGLAAIHRSGLTSRRNLLQGAAGALCKQEVIWPPEVVRQSLRRAQEVIIQQPASSETLIRLPQAALAALPADERAGLAGLLRWHADRADLLCSPPAAPGLRRWFERLLPPEPDSPDPHHAFTDACPLAGRLRVRLAGTLDRPGVAGLLRHCDEPPCSPAAEAAWLDALAVHLAAEPRGEEVLRAIAKTAVRHRPATCQVHRRGRLVTRRVWAERRNARGPLRRHAGHVGTRSAVGGPASRRARRHPGDHPPCPPGRAAAPAAFRHQGTDSPRHVNYCVTASADPGPMA